jgi:hypothetical protein
MPSSEVFSDDKNDDNMIRQTGISTRDIRNFFMIVKDVAHNVNSKCRHEVGKYGLPEGVPYSYVIRFVYSVGRRGITSKSHPGTLISSSSAPLNSHAPATVQ